jgi:predicted  nucleic acid-binding Zn-ribbon protein
MAPTSPPSPAEASSGTLTSNASPVIGPAALAAPQSSACWPYGENARWQRFSGSISTNDNQGERRINAAGTADGQRIVQRWIDDLRLCMRASGNVELDEDGSVGEVGEGGSLILEAELAGRVQSLTIRNDGGGEQLTWTVDGAARQVDSQVERWRDQMMRVLNEQARISTLRGQRSSLRGEISSIRGQRSSLRGQISSIRGQRSSLRGRISSIRGRQSSLNGEISSARGRVSTLRGQISSARGQVSSLRGQISTHRSAIAGLQASRYGASDEELLVIEAAVRRHEEAIAGLEQQIEAYDLDGRVATIERQIEAFDLEAKIAEIESRRDNNLEAEIAAVEQQIAQLDVEGKVAEIEQQIEQLDVEGRVAAIEAQIEALHVDERVEEIEQRLEPALRQLRDTIGSIR